MPRRPGPHRGMARITLPSQHLLSSLGPTDASLRSRWQQRSFGVPNRIWALLLLIASLVTFTRVLPLYQPKIQVSTVGLVSKNYFRDVALFPNNGTGSGAGTADFPFDFCPVFSPEDDLAERYGALALAQARIHQGSGGRIHRMLHKALMGQPVTISVLGGSGAFSISLFFRSHSLFGTVSDGALLRAVSACHGAGDDPLSSQCYPSLFFEWWLKVFPHPASELTNGAMRRTNSGYFSFCSAHHVPDHTDLVILEFDVDDPG